MNFTGLNLLRAICVCEFAQSSHLRLSEEDIRLACEMLGEPDATLPPVLALLPEHLEETAAKAQRILDEADGDAEQAALLAWQRTGEDIRAELRRVGIASAQLPLPDGSPDASECTGLHSTYAAVEPGPADQTRDHRADRTWPDKSRFKIGERHQPTERFFRRRFHARGGLGEIHVADDIELNREVALKEIRPRFAADEASRARFIMEGEVTGRLEHPGVVPVYGMGVDVSGSPYYAMRFIRGESLDAAIKTLHSNAGEAGRVDRLALQRLLRRFISVCQTIDYAHSRGVLHRDIKPENIMLGPYGESLVVDWGLAKFIGRKEDEQSALDENTEESLRPEMGQSPGATVRGSVAGTLLYMSPEQALGQHDRLQPAADVFSLGAVLFEILTGRTMYVAKTATEALRKAIQCEPAAARSVAPAVARPLESICLKATHRNPENRYASAEELANDIEAFLADEPTLAHKDTWFEATARWARKNKALVSTVAGVGLILLIGLTAFSALLSSKNKEIAAANKEVTKQRDEAEENFRTARSAVRDYLGALARDQRLSENGLDKLKLSLADAAAPYYEKFLGASPDDPELAFEQAELQASLAVIASTASSPESAAGYLDESISALQKLVQRYPDRWIYKIALARTLTRKGGTLSDIGSFQESVATYQQAFSMIQAVPNDKAEAIASSLPENSPFAYTQRQDLEIEIQSGQAEAALEQGDAAGSAAHIATATQYAWQQLQTGDSSQFASLVLPLRIEIRLLAHNGRLAEARTKLMDLLHLLGQMEVPQSLHLKRDMLKAELLIELGSAWLGSGYSRKALESYTDAHDQVKQLVEQVPDNRLVRNAEAVADAYRLSMGNRVAIDVTNVQDAAKTRLAKLQTSADALKAQWLESPRILSRGVNYAVALHQLAGQLMAMGDRGQAHIEVLAALQVTAEQMENNPKHLSTLSAHAWGLLHKADSISWTGQAAEAKASLEESLQLANNAIAPISEATAMTINAEAYRRLAQMASEGEERIKYAQMQMRALDETSIVKRNEPAAGILRSETFELMYYGYQQQNKTSEARQAIRDALKACANSRLLAPEEPQYPIREMFLHLLLAQSYMQTGLLGTILEQEMPDEAMSEFQKALVGLESADLRWVRADLLDLSIQSAAMIADYERSRDQDAVAATHLRLCTNVLAELYRRTGDPKHVISQVDFLIELYAAEYNSGKAEAAQAALDEASTLTSQLLAVDPYDKEARRLRTLLHASQAENWYLEGEYRAAAQAYGLALDSAEPSAVPELRLYRGLSNARLDRYRLAVEDIELTQLFKELSGTEAYEAAIVYALAIPVLAADDTQSDASKESLTQYYTNKAVGLLTRDWETSEYGPKESLQFLEEDDELNALRGREPFEALMERCRAEVQNLEKPGE